MKKILSGALIIAFCISILILSFRGNKGYPKADSLNELDWTDDGPLELSPERGRFALTYSVVENNSVFFDLPLARFVTPDLGYFNGNYISLFAPGVSFLTIPGYIIGRIFDLSQVGVYLNIALFGLLNLILIRNISVKLGVSSAAGWLAGFTYLFASPAFIYAGSLFQHHISTFLLLLSLYVVIFSKKIWYLALVCFLIAVAISVDYPNIVMLFPVILYGLAKFIEIQKNKDHTYIRLKLTGLTTFTAGVLPLLLFLWFNNLSYGSPFKLSGTVTRVEEIDNNGEVINRNEITVGNTTVEKTATGFFKTRNLINGLVVHSFSLDRGIIIFTPVIILGLLGIKELYKKSKNISALLLSIILFNIVFYSLWGDPWGGWAFGSRYLVPTYAILAIFLSFALSAYIKKALFLLTFITLFIYSVGVNTLGVLTSSRNPPFVEIANLELLSGKKQKFSFDRNIEFLEGGKSKSFIYNTYLKNSITAREYYYAVYGLIIFISGIIIIRLFKYA